jgi:hypothetical protein
MSLQRFIENINGIGGLAKTNRFKVFIRIPRVLGTNYVEQLSLLCETAELPGKTLQTADVKVYGPTYKIPYQKQFQDISLTFLCSNRGTERDIFDRWIDYIMPNETNNMSFPKGVNGNINEGYLTDITINHLNESISREDYDLGGDVIRKIQLIDVFPLGYAAQPLNWGDDGFQKLTVQFAYRKFIDNPFDESGPDAVGVEVDAEIFRLRATNE